MSLNSECSLIGGTLAYLGKLASCTPGTANITTCRRLPKPAQIWRTPKIGQDC